MGRIKDLDGREMLASVSDYRFGTHFEYQLRGFDSLSAAIWIDDGSVPYPIGNIYGLRRLHPEVTWCVRWCGEDVTWREEIVRMLLSRYQLELLPDSLKMAQS